MKDIIKLLPYYSEKIWGYEKWQLSTHKNGYSLIEKENNNLFSYIGRELPILIKIIKADDDLSIQVHPNNELALRYENDKGKNECWYILDAKEDAEVICGLKKGISEDYLIKRIREGNVLNCLNRIKVKKGDMIYIPSGTVHSILGGITLVEVQQNSDITYRLYDFGRGRRLNIEKGIKCIDYENKNKCGKIDNFNILSTPDFTVEKIKIGFRYNDKVNKDYYVFYVLKGKGIIYSDDTEADMKAGDMVLVKYNTNYHVKGNLEVLKIYY